MSEATDACNKCNKPQSSLSLPLKKCAKCQTTKYCSRDCQKADFKQHKKSCRPPEDGASHSSINRIRADITTGAKHNIDLLVALLNTPGVDRSSPRLASPAILRYLIEFCMNTHNVYWARLLQSELSTSISAPMASDPEGTIARGLAKMEEEQKSGVFDFEMLRWPRFDQETYQDAVGRTTMAALVVADESRQTMFGQPPGEIYKWSKGVDEVVKRQLGAEDFNGFRNGS